MTLLTSMTQFHVTARSMTSVLCASALAIGVIAPARAAGDPPKVKVTIKPLAGAVGKLKSVGAHSDIVINGTLNMPASSKSTPTAKQTLKGSLTLDVYADNTANRKAIGFSGTLLGPIFNPAAGNNAPQFERMDIFAVNKDVFVTLDDGDTTCVKPKSNAASFNALTGRATTKDLIGALGAIEKPVTIEAGLLASETVAGIPSIRYKLDGATLKQTFSPMFTVSDQTIDSAEIWIAVKGSYVTQIQIKASGNLSQELLANMPKLRGTMTVTHTLVDVNVRKKITLPASCADPIIG
jgi:hypothetical protein